MAAAGGFSTPDAVQKGGCRVAAMQIAAEPLLRQEVRKQYQVGGARSSAALGESCAPRKPGTTDSLPCPAAGGCPW